MKYCLKHRLYECVGQTLAVWAAIGALTAVAAYVLLPGSPASNHVLCVTSPSEPISVRPAVVQVLQSRPKSHLTPSPDLPTCLSSVDSMLRIYIGPPTGLVNILVCHLLHYAAIALKEFSH